jgi:nitric oxide reductase subunit B
MTELIILGKMIRDFRVKTQDNISTRFAITQKLLLLSEKWIFMNLSLALLMSVPAINIYTHGTHITVAHAMGTTIGINTVILLASVFCIFDALLFKFKPNCFKSIQHGINAFHISLIVFWVSLISAGLIKGVLTHHSDMNFSAIMEMLVPFFIVFFIAGLALLFAFLVIATPVITVALRHFRGQKA